MNERPFHTGQMVTIRPELLPGLRAATGKRLAGRVGQVQRCFVRLGSREWEVSVQWLRKNGMSTMGVPEVWRADVLEAKA